MHLRFHPHMAPWNGQHAHLQNQRHRIRLFVTADVEKAICVHFHINIDHLMFKHEFTPTDLTAWGTDINISDPAPALTTPTAPDPSNTLSPTFQQLIVDLANDTCTTPTLVPTITTSSGTSILH
mmetsp:Transcript_29005/g.60310  ORF Transcript_29005/g.60310 Transcript_29005/m.60310 type:complete len:124 (+) Transcript_29005:239-610(+)